MDIKKDIEKIKKMPQEEFEAWINERRSDIWSFPGMYPPGDATFLGSILRGETRYLYYMDAEGDLYYESDSGLAFKKMMQRIHLESLRT